MITVKLFSTIALALVTALVIFFGYQAMTRDALRRPHAFPDLRPATSDRAQQPRASEHEDVSIGAGRAPQNVSRAVAQSNAGQLALRERSETYIRTSVLIAIRDAGYECFDIISAHPGADDLDAWRVACDGALAYLVAVDDSGNLAVDPVPYGEWLVVPVQAVPLDDRGFEPPFELPFERPLPPR